MARLDIPRAEVKKQARQALQGRITPLVLAALIIFGLTFLVTMITESTAPPELRDPEIYLYMEPVYSGSLTAYNILNLLGSVFLGILGLGFSKMGLDLTYGITLTPGMVFQGFTRFWKAFVLLLLVYVRIFLWSLLLIVPGIIAAYRYSQAVYIFFENPELSASEVLRRSGELMRGHKWEYFVYELSFFWWFMLGIVTLGLAFFYVAPYQAVTFGAYYRYLNGSLVWRPGSVAVGSEA